MIEPMNKIYIILHNKEKKRSLAKLQNIGKIHLECKENIVADKYRILLRKKNLYESLLQKITKLHESTKKLNWFRDKNYLKSIGYYLLGQELSKEKSIFFPEDLKTFHQRMLHLEEKFVKLEKKYLALDEMKRNLQAIKPWGEIDWDKVAHLENKGIHLEFYIATEKTFQNHPYTDEYLFPIFQNKNVIYLIRLLYNPTHKKSLIFEKIEVPRLSLSELQKDIQILEDSIRKDEAFLSQFYNEREKITLEIKSLENLLEFEKAKQSLLSHPSGLLFGIEGYHPSQEREWIQQYLSSEKIPYWTTQPSPEDNVPIKLKNNFFTKAFEPITKIFALPKYTELDPTPFFAPFFTIFFGLCLGDIGYGFLLLLVSIASFKYVPKSYLYLSYLLLYLSLSAMISGFFMNSFFGENFFKVSNESFYVLEQGKEWAFLASYTIQGKTTYPTLPLSLLLGYLQLNLGILLQATNRILNKKFFQSIQPLSILFILWGATILAFHTNFLNLGLDSQLEVGGLPLGKWIVAFPYTLGEILLYLGIFSFFLFSRLNIPFPFRVLPNFWDFYQFLIGFTGDILSYIRLFALGLASGLLGNAFNQVSYMLLPETPGFSINYLFSAIVLILGHGLNFALSILGSFVHPLRLTFVEFYKNLSFAGGGREFQPFGANKNQ